MPRLILALADGCTLAGLRLADLPLLLARHAGASPELASLLMLEGHWRFEVVVLAGTTEAALLALVVVLLCGLHRRCGNGRHCWLHHCQPHLNSPCLVTCTTIPQRKVCLSCAGVCIVVLCLGEHTQLIQFVQHRLHDYCVVWSSLDGFNVNLLAGLKADVRVRAIAMGLDDEAVRLACERHCLVVGQCSVPIHPQLPIDLVQLQSPASPRLVLKHHRMVHWATLGLLTAALASLQQVQVVQSKSRGLSSSRKGDWLCA
mmetsp:Transcript_15158/g.45701  ORF Transcript_15158/g.45701 Transcript_15158/m.45701 type:complete len:259 (+) Transcript_15158:827-1603(+)